MTTITTSDKLYTADLTVITGIQRRRHDGSDITDLRAGGYDIYLYKAPTYDPDTQKLGSLQKSAPYVSEAVIDLTAQEKAEKLEAEITSICDQIDRKAGQKRQGLISPGELTTDEYLMAYEDAVAYEAAGYAGTVPGMVQNWADAQGWTAMEAADDIIATRNQWYDAATTIRSIRLSRKAQARAATTLTEARQVLTDAEADYAALPF